MATQIDPKNVIGRDQLIAQIWKMLAKGSVRFTAERRVGKTSVRGLSQDDAALVVLQSTIRRLGKRNLLLFTAVSDRKEAFFGFFDIQHSAGNRQNRTWPAT